MNPNSLYKQIEQNYLDSVEKYLQNPCEETKKIMTDCLTEKNKLENQCKKKPLKNYD